MLKSETGIMFIKSIPLLLLIVAFLFNTGGCSKQAPIRIAVITGGHDYDRDAFFKMFDQWPDISYQEMIQPEANQIYGSPEVDNIDVLVFYDMVQEISEEQKTAFIHLLEKGKGIVFLHHSLVSYQDWDEFGRIIGGRYILGDDTTNSGIGGTSTYKHDVDVPVHIVDRGHPVTQGLEDFVIHDEVYGNFTVLPTVHPLLSTTHPESSELIGWVNPYGNSRIVYIQLGHDKQAWQDANFMRLVKQAINWAGEELK